MDYFLQMYLFLKNCPTFFLNLFCLYVLINCYIVVIFNLYEFRSYIFF